MSEFKLTILGCGSATPTVFRNPSAQIVEISGRQLLIDCGEGTQTQMRRFKVKFQKLDAIFISHLHGDHYLGLVGLLQSLNLFGRTIPLHLYGPIALKEIIDIQFKHCYSNLDYDLIFTPTQVQNQALLFEDNCIEVHSFPLKHRINTTGFLIKEKPKLLSINKSALAEYKIPVASIHSIKEGKDFQTASGEWIENAVLTLIPNQLKSYAYCSDTIYDEGIVQYIKDVNLLYHESTFLHDLLNRAKETYHTTAKQAANIALLANVKQLMLGHFSARYLHLDAFLTEAKIVFENSILAEEGKVFDVL